MIEMSLKNMIYIFLFFQLSTSCKKEQAQIEPISSNIPWSFPTPKSFPSPVYTFENNAYSYARFSLGKHLFYDPILSLDSTVSCATCHAQTHGFADHNIPFSKGVGGALGNRNAPPIFNMAWSPLFFWDGRVKLLDHFSIEPITNPIEMKETVGHVIAKLNKNKVYRARFKAAYNIDSITEEKLQQALSQYMALVISASSKYDQFLAGKVTLTTNETNGMNLFKQHCVSCHKGSLFTDYSFRNNGLDSIFKDIGRESVTKDSKDRGKFKVPTLRNAEFTYPYMHDGRFISLMDVINHYTSGIKKSETLDLLLQNPIELTSNEKKDLLKFLFTLTDYSLLGDTSVAEPIK
jgi:cytochrome c peroxidase